MSANDLAPTVSVIVPAHNAEADLDLLFSALRAQTAPPHDFEVIVVDDGSSDGTAARVCSEPGARLLETKGRVGPYPARNIAAAAARGRLLAFTDADCVPLDTWIENGLARFAGGSAAMLAGAIRIPLGENPSPVALLDGARHLNQELYASMGYGATANMWVRKDVFDAVGGFNTMILSGGDRDFGRRAGSIGAELEFAEELLVEHPPRTQAREMIRKRYRIGVGVTQAYYHEADPPGDGRLPWQHVRAWLPEPSLKGVDRLIANGYAPGRLKTAQLLALQYLLITLPTLVGSLAGTLGERWSALKPHPTG